MKNRNPGILAMAIALAALCYPLLARAEPSPELVHAIARICVSEASFRQDVTDCPAIVEVLRGRASRLGRSLLSMARSYAPRATGRRPPRGPRQAWVAALRMDLAEPEPWARYNALRERRGLVPLPWNRHRSAWERRIAEARDLLRSPREVCEEQPMHWGARFGLDYERPMRLGWLRVDCGASLNYFWKVPRRR